MDKNGATVNVNVDSDGLKKMPRLTNVRARVVTDIEMPMSTPLEGGNPGLVVAIPNGPLPGRNVAAVDVPHDAEGPGAEPRPTMFPIGGNNVANPVAYFCPRRVHEALNLDSVNVNETVIFIVRHCIPMYHTVRSELRDVAGPRIARIDPHRFERDGVRRGAPSQCGIHHCQ